MSSLSVTYDTNNFYVDWGDYYVNGLNESSNTTFARNFVKLVSLMSDHIIIKLADKTKFKIALTQLDENTNIISNFNNQPVTDLTAFYNELKLLIK